MINYKNSKIIAFVITLTILMSMVPTSVYAQSNNNSFMNTDDVIVDLPNDSYTEETAIPNNLIKEEATTTTRASSAVISNGLYAIRKVGTDVYVKNNTLDELAWVFQELFSSAPTSSSDRDYLFKIAYRAATDDYVIRSMSNNAIIIYPSVLNDAPVAGKITVSGSPATDSNLSTSYAWKITETSDGYFYIWYQSNGTKYYVRSTSNEGDGPVLHFTTNSSDSGTKWNFHQYTGEAIDGIGRLNFAPGLLPGETYTHQAYMYSSTIGRNGPVSYASANSSVFTVDSSSGYVTAVDNGAANLWVTYPGAPLMWGRITTVEDSLEGTYYIKNKSTAKYITPSTVSSSSSIEQWSFSHGLDQGWELIYSGMGYYSIKNLDSGLYLTSPVSNVSGELITNESILDAENTNRQLWRFILMTDNSYQIKAKNRNTFVISSISTSVSNGANISQQNENNGNITKWDIAHYDAFSKVGGVATTTVEFRCVGTLAMNSTWLPLIRNAVSAWNSSGAGTNLSVTTSGTSQHTITVESNVATWYGLCVKNPTGNVVATSSEITINSRTLPNNSNTRQSTIAHEMAHVLWLSDNPVVLNGNKSLMRGDRDRTIITGPQAYDINNVKFWYD